MYTKCMKCKCELSSYLPFNANKKEWFCTCCEGSGDCPTPKERTFEDPGGWDSFGMGEFMPPLGTKIPAATRGMLPLPTSPSIRPAGGLSKTERMFQLGKRLTSGSISIGEYNIAANDILNPKSQLQKNMADPVWQRKYLGRWAKD